MSTYRKLLAIVATGHDDCAALTQASQLALQCQAELGIVSVNDPKETVADPQVWLDACLARLGAAGVKASGYLLGDKSEPEAMLAEIQRQRPDLVIKQLRRESVMRRLFFTPDDWLLARQSPRPLWVVGEDFKTLPRKVVAAVDIGSSEADAALNQAVIAEARRLAQACGAELHLAHICEPIIDVPEDGALQVLGTSPTLSADIQRLHEQRFAVIAEAQGVPEARRHFGFGRIERTLQDLCERIDAELIVTGHHDNSRLQRFLMGSISEDLLSHAHQSILVVRMADEQASGTAAAGGL